MIALADIVAGTAGRLIGEAIGLAVAGVAQHSGTIQPGEIFVAIRGEVHDGHAFIPQALANGAVALLVADDWAAAHPDQPVPIVAVPDTVAALQRLARWWRDRRPDLLVVGVTGSVGKTSTKEALAGVLNQRWPVLKNEGNLNTEIGLPLTLLQLRPEQQAAVLEIGGAYAMGEVALLAGIARPRVGIVTNVGPTHLARMGTLEAIAETKAELVRALPADGLAVLNGDDARVRAMAAGAACLVLTFGHQADNDLVASDVRSLGFDGLTCAVRERDGAPVVLRVPWPGRHSVYTALAAAAVGRHVGLDWPEIERGLAAATPVKHRLQRVAGPNGALLIDDTYNASPASTRSALELLAEAPARRRLAVLGGMAELGSEEAAGHAEIGALVAGVADLIVTYGSLAARLTAPAARAAGGRVVEMATCAEMVAFLRGEVRAGDVVLLKGSRGLAMDEIVTALAGEG
ncbi:MAG: UDP-N-acetylmuramoyl-tripeptide--D-alanyl-D-alanine ligase [Chloroflexi bacterium]|nr:UDP-N-acetylmuramoyl-tripeptide--D-alanyl-D-alanine ligase [Chloroflexota bacterium]